MTQTIEEVELYLAVAIREEDLGDELKVLDWGEVSPDLLVGRAYRVGPAWWIEDGAWNDGAVHGRFQERALALDNLRTRWKHHLQGLPRAVFAEHYEEVCETYGDGA